MRSLIKELTKGRILVSDGAWGTFLQKKGLQPGQCPESWNIDHRKDVLAIAQSYSVLGVDMLKTNSFGGNRIKLKHFGLEGKAFEFSKAAAEISREAAGERFVLGSIGPTGKMLMMGDVSEQELCDAFSEQATGLAAGGADVALIETFSAIDEAVIAINAVKKNTRLEIACTFSFERTASGEYRSMMGVSPAEMAAAVTEAGAHIVGTNCGNGMERMIDIAAQLRAVLPASPILIHANAGMPVVKDGATIYPETPAKTAGFVPRIIEAGANIIGGCCGTGPQHIKAIIEAVQKG
jgi:5-methyltetrahydrofolate--homocysteine methyltransferase